MKEEKYPDVKFEMMVVPDYCTIRPYDDNGISKYCILQDIKDSEGNTLAVRVIAVGSVRDQLLEYLYDNGKIYYDFLDDDAQWRDNEQSVAERVKTTLHTR